MRKFRVFVHGINFQMPAQDKVVPELLGFYTNAFIEAESAEKAEFLAIDLLRDHPSLKGVLNAREDPPRLFAEEIIEIEDWPPDTARPLTGLAFYDDPDVSWRKESQRANI